MLDHHGEIFDSRSARGKLVMIFFGYTSCPDVCPMELSVLAQVLNALEENEDKVQALFISVDPEKDSPQVLKQYVSYFSQNLLGLTGSKDDINAVTQQYRAQSNLQKINQQQREFSSHSANLYLLDTDGSLLNIIPFGLPVEHILQIINTELNKS